MAQDYCIWIVSPPGYVHSSCFEEVALALREAFVELGHNARIVTDPADTQGRTIVLGANLIPRVLSVLPPHYILFNLEQIGDDRRWLTPAYIELLRQQPVWDYSSNNIAALAKYGVRATLCEIGYSPGLTRIPLAADRDIDIAFMGSRNDRRKKILNALEGAGKKVFAGLNLYGAERDAIYGRAKIAINIHYFESKVFEIVRCSYLLANRICVVSESGSDADVENVFRSGVAFTPYEGLVDTCLQLLENENDRARIAEAGFATFSARAQAPLLKAALIASGAGV